MSMVMIQTKQGLHDHDFNRNFLVSCTGHIPFVMGEIINYMFIMAVMWPKRSKLLRIFITRLL